MLVARLGSCAIADLSGDAVVRTIVGTID